MRPVLYVPCPLLRSVHGCMLPSFSSVLSYLSGLYWNAKSAKYYLCNPQTFADTQHYIIGRYSGKFGLKHLLPRTMQETNDPDVKCTCR
jgi:hypothetical protein